MEPQRVSLEDLGTSIESLLDLSVLHRVSVQLRTGHFSSESGRNGSLFHESPEFHSDFRLSIADLSDISIVRSTGSNRRQAIGTPVPESLGVLA